jgi:serine/threonine protein kinase
MSNENGPPDIKILSANEAVGYDQSTGAYTGGSLFDSAAQEESVRNWTARGGVEEPLNVRKVGRFVVLGALGRGGMGEVLKAQDPLNGRIVALKILDDEALKDRETLMRFEREAAAAADLEHPNIAKMYGMHYDDEGRPFLVMEYVDGTPLDKIIRERLDLQFSQILDWITQVARGLEYARRRGIIHRDIKPANIIVDSDNSVRIIDFGLAKSMWDTTGLTATGMVVGTPRYMSPEQGMGRNVDHRSDIYALGATLYELITKQTPFDGDTPMSIMMKHINSPLTPPYVLHPKCPSDVNEIVVKMLAKDPNQRYQDYEPLIHDLESARIHRLAKERAHEIHNSDDLHGAATMVDLEPASHSYTGSGSISASGTVKKPNPYLSEGLVKLDMSNIPDVEDAPRSPMMMIMIGVIALAIVSFLWYRQSTTDGTQGKNPGWLSRALSSAFSNKRSETADAEAVAKQDEEFISTTLSRIDGLKTQINRYRRANGGQVPSVRDLQRANLLPDEALGQDAWGNTFQIRREGTDVLVIAAGRDGIFGSTDDFRIGLESSRREIPAAIRPEDVATGAVRR